MDTENKTIFAAATPIGESSISVIRISGKDAFSIVSKIFSRTRTQFERTDIADSDSHRIEHGYIFVDGEVIDEVLISIFKSPKSFTGENCIEISTHGGAYVYRKVSDLLLKLGCAPAAPGEFSKKAFLNGKIDLTQAEAIADLIRSKTELSYKAALGQLKGQLSDKIIELREELINYCSLVELELDFSEEGLELIKKEKLFSKIDKIINSIENLTKTYESGRIIKNGINLAITGKTNVGKSSIFNYLLNDNRAIVSNIPGTTRDYLQEPLVMGGLVFNLIDTAGIRNTSNAIEKEGVERSFQKINESDITLNVMDLTSLNGYSKSSGNGSKAITVFNKADLSEKNLDGELCISAKTGENMDILQEKIVEKAKSLLHR
ncbi:MAG: tRNA uridine-5-carboxymethylaminomethyl(34) synthesis GTPase MnmE, partial [Ignavibacteria bacterium]